MPDQALRRNLRCSFPARGLPARLLVNLRSRRLRERNRGRMVQIVEVTGRLVEASHRLMVNHRVMAGTPAGQSSRKGVVRLMAAAMTVMVEMVLGPASVPARAGLMRTRLR